MKTSIRLASERKHYNIVKLLVSFGADIDTQIAPLLGTIPCGADYAMSVRMFGDFNRV